MLSTKEEITKDLQDVYGIDYLSAIKLLEDNNWVNLEHVDYWVPRSDILDPRVDYYRSGCSLMSAITNFLSTTEKRIPFEYIYD